MTDSKEAVEAVARAIAKAEGYDWYSIKGGQLLHDRFYVRARAAIAAARPHILEEARRIVAKTTDSMEPPKSLDHDHVGRWRVLAIDMSMAIDDAIRVAKEGER